MNKQEILGGIEADVKKMLGRKVGSKKRVNSIRKGKTFERTVAKLLTESLGIEFARVPQSGAFSTIHQSEIWSGDLVCVDKNIFNPFHIEAKHYRGLDLLDVLSNKKTNKFFEWIDQSERDSQRNQKIPLIIFRFNNSPIYVLSNYNHFKNGNLFLKNTHKIILFYYQDRQYLITIFENFLIKDLYNYLKNKNN